MIDEGKTEEQNTISISLESMFENNTLETIDQSVTTMFITCKSNDQTSG